MNIRMTPTRLVALLAIGALPSLVPTVYAADWEFTGNAGLDFYTSNTDVYVPETHQAQRGKDNGFIGIRNNESFNLNYQAFGILDYFFRPFFCTDMRRIKRIKCRGLEKNCVLY